MGVGLLLLVGLQDGVKDRNGKDVLHSGDY